MVVRVKKVKTKEYRTGRIGQHKSLIETHTQKVSSQDDFQEVALGYDPKSMLRNEIELFTRFLESKGIDSDYKGRWDNAGNRLDLSLTNDDGLPIYEGGSPVLSICTHIKYVSEHFGDIPGATIAAKGLMELWSAEIALERGDFKTSTTCILRAAACSRFLLVAEMEPQWLAGKSRTGDAHTKRTEKANEWKEKAEALFKQLRTEYPDRSKNELYRMIERRLSETDTPRKLSAITGHLKKIKQS